MNEPIVSRAEIRRRAQLAALSNTCATKANPYPADSEAFALFARDFANAKSDYSHRQAELSPA